MGVELAVAGAALAAGAYGAHEQYKAGKEQAKAMREANDLAREAAEAEREKLAEEKAEKLKERKTLVDNMRAQLGVGLGMGNIVSTRFKSALSGMSGTSSPAGTLG